MIQKTRCTGRKKNDLTMAETGGNSTSSAKENTSSIPEICAALMTFVLLLLDGIHLLYLNQLQTNLEGQL